MATEPIVSQPTGNESTFIHFEDRLSDSPLVERVWRCHSVRAGKFLSIAAPHFEMAVTRHRGKTFLTLRGPETKATTLDCPAEGEWLGIRFKPGTFMPQFLPGSLRDQRDVTLPDATSRAFWLNGSAWQYPDFESADTFVKRLAKAGVISRDSTVDAVLQGQPRTLSLRSAQRHFLRATGMTHATFRQIELEQFYGALFGWKIDSNNSMKYGVVDTAGGPGGINGGVGPSQDGGKRVSVYAQVDDLQATLDKAEKLGGKTILPPSEVPGGPKLAMFADPAGNVTGLVLKQA